MPARFDKRQLTLREKLADTVTVSFGVDNYDATLTADLPPERVQARAEAALPITEKMLKRNVRQVSIGNGLYPNDARAKELGLTKDELAEMFRSGLMADPATVAANGTKLKEKLEAGKEVRIMCPNGTDLTLGVTKRPVSVTDGVISDEKLKAGGGAACQGVAARFSVKPSSFRLRGTATGKVVVARMVWEGKEINDLKITFKDGKVEENDRQAESRIRAAPGGVQGGFLGPGKDELEPRLDIGLNPNVKLPAKAKDGQFMVAGMVTVTTGGNTWAGGENKCPFGNVLFIRDRRL